MKKQDGPELLQRLTQLAEVLASGRAPSGNAIPVWLDVLGECAHHEVMSVLTDWPKTNTRMPLPADILRLCRTRVSDRIERQAEENLRSATTIDEVVAKASRLKRERDAATQAAYEAFLVKFERFKKAAAEPKDHKEWARVLRVKEEAGEHLMLVQMENWRVALGYPKYAPLEEIDRLDNDRIKL